MQISLENFFEIFHMEIMCYNKVIFLDLAQFTKLGDNSIFNSQ